MIPFQTSIIFLVVLALIGLPFCSRTVTEEELFTEAQKHLSDRDAMEAVKVYERIIIDFPESENRSKAVFMLGFLYANELYDLDRARKYYTQMLEEYPDHELTTSAKFELDNLGKDIMEIDSILVERIQEQELGKNEKEDKYKLP